MMEMFLGLNLLLILMMIGFFVLWIWAMVDIIISKFTEDILQIVWLLVVFFLPVLGVLLYLIIGRSMKKELPSTPDPMNKYDHLSKLKALLDEGVISEQEFEAEKQKILNS